MMSSGMLRRVALVGTDVSEEFSASSMRRFLVTANVPSSPILVTLMMEEPRSSETSVLTRATLSNIPEDAILRSHHHENLKSCTIYILSSIVVCMSVITVITYMYLALNMQQTNVIMVQY
jgi:hypothetical protein